MTNLANAIFYEAEYRERYFRSSPNNRADWLTWMRRYVWAGDLPPFCIEQDARSAAMAAPHLTRGKAEP